jgi:glycosyltransferase involved in cell wall biosynthesis
VTRVLIAEFNHTGHRLMFVRHLAEAALESGLDCTVLLTEEGAQSIEAEIHLGAIMRLAQVVTAHGVTGCSPKEKLRLIRAIGRSKGAQRIVLPDGDGFLSALLRTLSLRSSSWSVLCMRSPTRTRGGWLTATGRIKQVVLYLLAWRGIDLGLLVAAAGEDGVPQLPVYPVRDAIPFECSASKSEMRNVLGLSESAMVVGIFGALNGRKNVGAVIEAVATARLAGDEFVLCAGGKPDADTDRALRAGEASGTVARYDANYLSDSELDGRIRACDVLVLAYANDGPSGLFAKALASGVNVVVVGPSRLSRAVESTSHGVVSRMNTEGLAAALRLASALPEPRMYATRPLDTQFLLFGRDGTPGDR